MNDETDQQILDCENREERLTEWEGNFIQSVREQFDKKGELSEKQLEILDKIWNRVT